MATGATLTAFQRQYQTLHTLCDSYNHVHSRLIRALRTSLALLARIKSLAALAEATQLDTPIPGDSLVSLTPLMVSKTVSRLTRLIHGTIPDVLEELVAVTKSMQTVKRQAQELNSRLRKSASDKAMAVRSGPIPSVRQCVDGVAEIVESYVRETRLCTLVAGRERGWLDGMTYMCLNDDVRSEAGANRQDTTTPRRIASGSDRGVGDRDRREGERGALLDACTELVDVLGCLEARRKLQVAQIEMMHTVLATVEVRTF